MNYKMFQHTAARRRLQFLLRLCGKTGKFQHTAARRRLPLIFEQVIAEGLCFNTQPRGGGCLKVFDLGLQFDKFQHTAARRRLLFQCLPINIFDRVSTHSRAEAAARILRLIPDLPTVSTHSRAEAAA